MPAAQWPEPALRSFAHMNKAVYVPMQGPSELGASGILADWDRTADLHEIAVPTLVVGAGHDICPKPPGYGRNRRSASYSPRLPRSH